MTTASPPTDNSRWKLKPCPRCGVEDWFFGQRKRCSACEHSDRNSPKARQQNAARKFTTRAIRLGKLVRQPCIKCVPGQQRKTSQAHHEDYSKPLDVIWLCPMHHRWLHMEKAKG